MASSARGRRASRGEHFERQVNSRKRVMRREVPYELSRAGSVVGATCEMYADRKN